MATFDVAFHRVPEDPDYVLKREAVEALDRAGVTGLPPELVEYFKVDTVPEVDELMCVGSMDVIGGGRRGRVEGGPEIPDDGILVTHHVNDKGAWVEIDVAQLPSDVRLITVGMTR